MKIEDQDVCGKQIDLTDSLEEYLGRLGSDKCPNLHLQPSEEPTLRLKIRMTEVRGTSQVTSGLVVVLSMRCPHGYWLRGEVVTVVVPEGTMSLSQMLP